MSANWDAVRTGDLDALGAAIFDKMADRRDDPSSVEQEMADAALALIERCAAAEARATRAEGALRGLGHVFPDGWCCCSPATGGPYHTPQCNIARRALAGEAQKEGTNA
jgi:hypothetical protein